MVDLSRIYFMTTSWFGAGALDRLPLTLSELGIKRPMLVADAGLVAAGLVDRALDAMSPAPVVTFLETPPNPTQDACVIAAGLFRAAGADGIVALGGGSPIDLAKAVALLGTHSGALADYDVTRTDPGAGSAAITTACAPVIAVPTTAGTGSEVGRAAVISTGQDAKLILLSQYLVPRTALVDPVLAVGLPRAMTAGAGMDAFSHCIEGFLAPNRNPPARAVALDGVRRIWDAIERACTDGTDMQARSDMAMGSLQGGMSMANGLGAVHAMSHAVGGIASLGLHHGTLNAVLLPPVLRHNLGDRNAAADLDKLAAALSLPAGSALPGAITALNQRLGLPASLRAMGVSPDLIPMLADKAVADFTSRTNCRPMTRADYLRLFEEALT
jgi:4-hydroxybutyrate dehydrogenase